MTQTISKLAMATPRDTPLNHHDAQVGAVIIARGLRGQPA